MSRRLLTISAAVLVLATFAAAQSAPPTANLVACSSTSDCASATCCGISVCVNRQFAPSENACTSVPCPAETVGPVTSCECSQNICKTVKDSIIVVVPVTNAPGVPNPPAPTFTEPADSLMACSADSECGMQTCCESNLCIARAFAPDCTNVTSRFCPAMQFNCQCQNNRCARGPTAAPPTTASPATPNTVAATTTSAPGDNEAEANTDSGASTVPVIASIATAVAACLVVYHL